MENNSGDAPQPCFTPLPTSKSAERVPFTQTWAATLAYKARNYFTVAASTPTSRSKTANKAERYTESYAPLRSTKLRYKGYF